MARQLLQLRSRIVVESCRRARVAPDARGNFLEALGGRDRGAVARLVHPDREDAVHAGGSRRGHQLGVVGLAGREVGVGVDHALSLGVTLRARMPTVR
jgi:hypothetical protein